MLGEALPRLKTRIPGPKSRRLARQLRQYESRNVTCLSQTWPVFWERAAGANIWDLDGNRYIDLTAAFGVASVGHTNPRISAALKNQAGRLIHAMGDVHPNELKLRLARELCQLTFQAPARVVFGTSGAEAVEIALKTAVVHTKRAGAIAFTGGYHGLTYGALDATWREDFRKPFLHQLGHFTTHIPYGELPTMETIKHCGAVIVEPIQGRGGIVVPPDEFLPALRKFCDRHKLVLIFDEIYTGFCRTGRWFAFQHWNVQPDILCVGKGMSGGFPMSACIGRASVMDSWPESKGEALHTSTFLGNPLGCAAALAAIKEMKRQKLADRAAKLGDYVRSKLPVRGKGLMLGLPVRNAPGLCERLLRAGVLALPEGEHGEVLGLTPPLTISRRQLDYAIRLLQ
jgi:4-aminobutyrate aminotransferase-like enzyme